ncbi:MAG: argininosuccinate lyase, partial [Candidatus Dadabacteria bacterium]
MPPQRETSRTWGGRFTRATAPDALAFTASIGFDIRLYPYDIRVSIAHARMLAACGIISARDRDRIVAGLRAIEKEIESGRFRPQLADEDIHMAIERRLVEKIGAVGAKLHAARSRNDQVATDARLFVKDAIDAIDAAIARLQSTLLDVAERDGEAVLPGYTHLQRAQPILLGHHLLAYYDMLERDRERLADCRRRTDVLPLGCGALAGTTLPIDRRMLAKELGFKRIAENSIDAISDRDFIAELLAALAIVFTHISRLASDITLWATSEFGFVVLDDAYSTGSSMMPQKKNPDIAELVRGKSGRVFGDLLALLTVLKGLPLAYNSDLQEDKEALFDAVDTTKASLEALAALVG